MLIDSIVAILDRLSLLPAGFRLYQRVSALSPRAYLKNRSYRTTRVQTAVPPARLLMSVAGSAEIAVFLEGGQLAADSIRDILRKNHIQFSQFRAVLDFGCGCGRVLRFWKDSGGIELYGTDADPELTAWCAQYLPFARIGTNKLAPPTTYSAEQFDFIYALSVLTHLPEADQMGWMNEFRRILRPGGYLFLSLHGAYYLPRLNGSERRLFLDQKLVTKYDYGAGTSLCNVFHPEVYVRQSLAKGFDVIDFVPEGARGNPRQDAWLFRRK